MGTHKERTGFFHLAPNFVVNQTQKALTNTSQSSAQGITQCELNTYRKGHNSGIFEQQAQHQVSQEGLYRTSWKLL